MNSGSGNGMYGVPSPTTGSKWMNNGIACKLVKFEDINNYIEQGYKLGRIKI